MYANNNDKAIKFGEAKLRQLGGHLGILIGELEDKKANGIVLKGGVFARHKGLSPDERRKALLDEAIAEVDKAETDFYHLTQWVAKLKRLVENSDPENDVWVWECMYARKMIAEATETNPLSFVEE